MLARRSLIAILFGSLLAGPGARAQDEAPAGPRRRVVVSAERFFGFGYTRRTEIGAPGESFSIQHTGTVLGPLGGSAATTAVFMTPRLAFDASVVRGLTLGTAIGYARASHEQEIMADAFRLTPAETTTTTFVVAPRAGYLVAVGETVAVWPRVGFTYVWGQEPFYVSSDPFTSRAQRTLGFYALSADVMAAVRLGAHLQAVAGATFDRSFAGSISTSIVDAPAVPTRKLEETDVGAVCGLAAAF